MQLPESVYRNYSGVQGDVYLTIVVKLASAASWAPENHEVTFFQHQLSTAKLSTGGASNHPAPFARPLVTTTASTWTIKGHDFCFVFDRVRGCLKSWTRNGVELLHSSSSEPALIPGFWRPATDNDVPHSYPYWQRFGLDQLMVRASGFMALKEAITITFSTFMSPPVLAWGWDCELKYVVTNAGSLQVYAQRLQPTGSCPEHIPRIGLDIRLNKALNQVTWYGLGPGESYPDKAQAQKVGIWEVDSVAKLQTPYDVPQENGNRMGNKWVRFQNTSLQGHGICIHRLDSTAEPPSTAFSFAASRYSMRTVQDAAHPTDLVEDEAIILRLDSAVSGVGTAACGPGVRPDLMVKCEETKFAFQFDTI